MDFKNKQGRKISHDLFIDIRLIDKLWKFLYILPGGPGGPGIGMYFV